ncbi:MAG: CBS domain-containing protein [Methylobacterium sp.]|uniref:CBS domain-containing protein n=1 Tax=Methylobacterium sp. TaxID=409 RepID=UPI002717140C|nr:CBS domain-containing protein [Methylobacterium sp.]MDO9426198.1 CBS domain-containing protein [Methylobacterium sp.]
MENSDASGRGAALHYIRADRTVRDAVRLLSRPGSDALVVIDGRPDSDGAIVGLLTERDIFRALTAGGLEVLDALVWTLARADFAAVDVGLAPQERLAAFCRHRTEHLAVMDGFALRSVESIWDCLAAPLARTAAPGP